MSRDLNNLIASFRADVVALLELCEQQGFKMVPYFTLRDPWEQAKLWRQSRSRAQIDLAVRRLKDGGAPWLADVLDSVGPQYGNHVTDALPGMSWHQWGEAVDCYVASATGGAIWDGQHPGYKAYAETGRELGLTAGYYWTSPFDPGHMQARAGNIRDLYSLSEIDQTMRDRFAMRDPIAIIPADRLAPEAENPAEDAVNQNDVDIMARTIFGEARGESEQGKVAVGWVIMSRVAFAETHGGYWWGNTIREVCLKPWQFSCWNRNDPNRRVIENVGANNSTFSQCLDIARRVISGRVPNPVEGATHYYADYIAPPSWVRGATLVSKIGVHSFYKDVA